MFEHHAGFLAALSPQGHADRTTAATTLGRRLRILDTGLSIKRYPMCYATHRVIDGVLDLVTANELKPAQVARVHARVGIAQASMLRNHKPQTGLEAKFSLEFAVAAAILKRRVGLRELTDAFVTQPQVQAMMTRLEISTSEIPCPIEPVFALNDRVEIELADGRRLDSGEIRFPRGNSQLPLSDDELKEKFLDCAGAAADLDMRVLYARLHALEAVDHIAALAAHNA